MVATAMTLLRVQASAAGKLALARLNLTARRLLVR
jgi:hypothetical protein